MQMAFVLVCAAEVVDRQPALAAAGPAGRTLSLALFPVEAFFWFGFALPFGFVARTARVALTVVRRLAA